MTTLSVESTCIDNLITPLSPPQDRRPLTGFLKSLFEQDLQITYGTFKRDVFRSHEWLAVLAEIRYENFTSPLLDDSELLGAILVKSDYQLQESLRQARYFYGLETVTLADALTMCTIIGWTDGCRVLLNANLTEYMKDPGSHARRFKRPLLNFSCTIGLDMLQLLLSQRESCHEPQLSFIGHFEDALSLDQGQRSDIPAMDVIQLVLSHLIKQRREIKLLMEKHELQHCCERARRGLPDAHVGCMLSALASEGVDVPQRYRPKRKSLYYMPQLGRSNILILFESFELASIRDTSQESFKCNQETACSPLMYLATQPVELGIELGTESGSLNERNMIVRWFLSRGADLKEMWPGTQTTALHCLAWQSAEFLWCQIRHPFSYGSASVSDSWTYEDFEFFIKEDILDECECGCSRSGCDFLSCFWKTAFGESRRYPELSFLCKTFENATLAIDLESVRLYALHGDSPRGLPHDFLTRKLLDLTILVEKAATTLSRHQLIYGYIRLFVFSYLEIRHTCCDIERIQHNDNPDFTKRPYPRYCPKELRRINEEDAHLRARLETLVPELISQHDSFSGKLQDFVIDVLIPTMRRTAKELKEEDKTLYAAGRRELGVVMDEDGNDTEGDEDDAEEEEVDSVEDSDDEY